MDIGNCMMAAMRQLQLSECTEHLIPEDARASFMIGRIFETQGYGQEPIYMRYYQDAIAKIQILRLCIIGFTVIIINAM